MSVRFGVNFGQTYLRFWKNRQISLEHSRVESAHRGPESHRGYCWYDEHYDRWASASNLESGVCQCQQLNFGHQGRSRRFRKGAGEKDHEIERRVWGTGLDPQEEVRPSSKYAKQQRRVFCQNKNQRNDQPHFQLTSPRKISSWDWSYQEGDWGLERRSRQARGGGTLDWKNMLSWVKTTDLDVQLR